MSCLARMRTDGITFAGKERRQTDIGFGEIEGCKDRRLSIPRVEYLQEFRVVPDCPREVT